MSQFVDGKWVEKEDVKISVFDLTFCRGYGLFEFLRTYHRKPFMLEEHLDRFFHGAEDLELPLNKTREEIRGLVQEGINRNHFEEVYIKIYLTGGITEDAMTPGTPSFILLFLPAKSYPESLYSGGMKLISTEYERYIPNVKSLNYMAAVVYHKKAKKENAQEVLYLDRNGIILEGSTINFFTIKNGKVYSPSDDILYGITRKFLLQVCQENGIEVVLGPIYKKDLSFVDEAFITSTTREVCPVVTIDDLQIGSGKVGPLSTF